MDLDPTFDATQSTSQTDLNTQDISNLMSGLNDLNDSISGTANIAAYGTDTFSAVPLTAGQSYTLNLYTFTHNLGYIPAYLLYVPGGPNVGNGPPPNFPAAYSYFTQVSGYYVTVDSNSIDYIWYAGIDTVNFYVACNLLNQNTSTETSKAQQLYFYLLSNPGVAASTA